MSRRRVPQRVRKGESHTIASGVFTVALDIAGDVQPGSLYWRAPIQYVCEQIAPRLAAAKGELAGRENEVAAYLLAGMNEYVIALVADFDREHFEAWIAAERGERVRLEFGAGSDGSSSEGD